MGVPSASWAVGRVSQKREGSSARFVRFSLSPFFLLFFVPPSLPPLSLSLSLCLSFFFSPSLNWSKFSDETTYSSRSNLFYSTSPRVTMPLENPLSFGSLDVGSLSLSLSLSRRRMPDGMRFLAGRFLFGLIDRSVSASANPSR